MPKLPPRSRQPWPMKWVVVAIFAMIVPYTWLTLAYRKPEKEFEPYHDMKDQASVIKLLDAGFQRMEAETDRPADPQRSQAAISATALVTDAPGGVPAFLANALLDAPLLSPGFRQVAAPREASALQPYRIFFTCELPDGKLQPKGAEVYLRGNNLVIVPQFETIPGELFARGSESAVVVTVPAPIMKAGSRTVTLAGEKRSKQWQLEVK
jgi:hypothetical protein